MPHVFISYVHENAEIVQRLCRILQSYGVTVWIDREQIKPGSRWTEAIQDAISEGSFYIACFSNAYKERSKSYMNEELTIAIEELRLRPTDHNWFIPVLLDETKVPNRRIGGGETLRSLQWVELFDNWDDGVRRILSVIAPHSAKVYELIRGLKEKSARARIRAADELGSLGPLAKEAVPSLIHNLSDENATVRAAAADALGKIGEFTDPMIAGLINVIRDGEFYSTKHAMRTLAQMGIRGIPAMVVATELDDTKPGYGIGVLAVEALAEIKDPDAITALLRCLHNRNSKVRSKAAYALRRFKEPSILPALMERLHDEDPFVLSHTASSLLQIGNPAAVGETLSILKQRMCDKTGESAFIRAEAARALGELGDISAIPSLMKTLEDVGQPFNAAGVTLLQIGTSETKEAMIPILTKQLGDEDEYVRNRAIDFLETTDSTAVIKPLRESLKSGNTQAAPALAGMNPPDVTGLQDALASNEIAIRLAVMVAIGKLTWLFSEQPNAFELKQILPELRKSVLTILERALVDDSPKVRRAATAALSKIGTPAMSLLGVTLRDEDAETRQLAAQTLAQIGPSAIPTLISGLNGPKGSQDMLVRIFCRLGQPAKDALRVLYENDDSQLRRAASNALDRIDAHEASITNAIHLSTKLPCERCSALILPRTAQKTGGYVCPVLDGSLNKRKHRDPESCFIPDEFITSRNIVMHLKAFFTECESVVLGEMFQSFFGDWSAIYRRFNLWSKKGIMIRLFNALKKSSVLEWEFIHGSFVKAHQHSSGASSDGSEAVGKSRWGNTTKIHLAVDSYGLPIEFKLSGVEVNDSIVTPDLIEQLPDPVLKKDLLFQGMTAAKDSPSIIKKLNHSN